MNIADIWLIPLDRVTYVYYKMQYVAIPVMNKDHLLTGAWVYDFLNVSVSGTNVPEDESLLMYIFVF